MKLRLLYTCMLLLSSSITFSQYQQVVFTPKDAAPGTTITFEYNPLGTTLSDSNDIIPVVLLFDGEAKAAEIILTKEGNNWKGTIPTNDSTKAILLCFKKQDAIDNNNGQGYSLILKRNTEPVKDGRYGLYSLNAVGAYLFHMRVKPETTLMLLEEELKNSPELLTKIGPVYFNEAIAADKNNGKQKVEAIIQQLINQPDKTENHYYALQYAYKVIKDTANAAKITKEIEQNYPTGTAAKNRKLDQLYQKRDPEKRLELLELMKKEFPAQNQAETASYETMLSNLYGNFAYTAGVERNWGDFNKYLALTKQNTAIAAACNDAAWGLTGKGFEDKGDSLEYAKQLSEKSLQHLQKEQQEATEKPSFLTNKEYSKNLDYTYGNYLDTYALILWKLNHKEAAYKAQEEAVEKTRSNNPDILERYLVFKEAVKGSNAVKPDLEAAVKNGQGSKTIKGLLKKIYLTEKKSEAGFETYMNALQKEHLIKLKAELVKQMIKEPAPKFELKDLTGNTVSLEKMKGKILIVDFWATWCGPCRASFPGMQLAQNSFKADKNVQFLFVDTREGVKPEEMKTKAGKFIKDNKYSFRVLLDTDDAVVNSYAVQGIPTKVIIDGNGNIRFKVVGYDGNEDKLVEEMKIMVEAIKGNS